jgi:uncharacterized membrane protein YvbJ
VRCSSCGIDNVEGARFCNHCATPLDKECPSCGFGNGPDARFCSQCGSPFESNHHTLIESHPTSAVTDGERRYLTLHNQHLKELPQLLLNRHWDSCLPTYLSAGVR